MGNARWDSSAWSSHSTANSAKPAAAIFVSRGMHDDLDPSKITVRECIASVANPNPTPVAIGLDVTGSMGHLAEVIAKKGLGTIMQEIYDRKPVSDPQIMLMAIGDANCDRAPLQATQFEGSMVLAEQLERLYLEGGGGGNDGESYLMAWYFVHRKTTCSAIVDDGRKGYLFTIGDEPPLMNLKKEHIKQFLNIDAEADITAPEILALLTPHWNVFHLIVNPGGYDASRWKKMMGERVLMVSDHTKLAEIIVSTIQVTEGDDIDHVTKSWSGDTSLVVQGAIGALMKGKAASGAVRL